MLGRKMTIRDWAKNDRPRQKLLEKRPQSLTDAELLSLLIGTGTSRHNSLDLARETLAMCQGSLQELGKCRVADLMKINGIGEAKATAIVAAMELSRRRHSELAIQRRYIGDSKGAAAYLQPLLADYRHEVFGVLFLDQSGGFLGFEIVSEGGITATTVDLRMIFKKAMEKNAVSIIVCHNHPSGSLLPSNADIVLTNKIQSAGETMDIRLLDHIVIGGSGYYSFANEGRLS